MGEGEGLTVQRVEVGERGRNSQWREWKWKWKWEREGGTHSGGVEERSSVARDSERGDDDQVHQMTQEEWNHHQEQESCHHTLDSLRGEREKFYHSEVGNRLEEASHRVKGMSKYSMFWESKHRLHRRSQKNSIS